MTLSKPLYIQYNIDTIAYMVSLACKDRKVLGVDLILGQSIPICDINDNNTSFAKTT